jgi:GntR family transcriptional regulator
LFLRVNTSSGVPIFRQIADQVKVLVGTGALETGARLPSVRQLAESLVINPTTVQRAYLELENEGVIETRRGQGTFVANGGTHLERSEVERLAAEHFRNALAEAKRFALTRAKVRKLFEKELKDMFGNEEVRDGQGG